MELTKCSSFATRLKKAEVLQKRPPVIRGEFFRNRQEYLDDLIKALTFASRLKKRAAKKAERSLKVWKQQHVNQVFTGKIMLANTFDLETR